MTQKQHNRCIRVGLSAFISLIILLITLVCSDIVIPLSSEKMLFKNFELLKQLISVGNEEKSSLLDSVLLIDTHYAQTLVNEYENTDTIGRVPVTDRRLLLQLLQHLSEDSTYKYILLDISLSKDVRQEEDTTLYHLIASMPRISISMPENEDIADSCLIPKTGEVGYYIAQWENDFVKYPYLQNGKKSLPLKMYEDLTGRTITCHGVFHTDSTLARSSVFLTYNYTEKYKIHYLEDKGFIDMITEDQYAKDKYVLIGDFEEDIHNTYIGELPGVIINYNAYLALIEGHHLTKTWMFFILFAAFFLLTYQTLTQSKFTWLFMWIGYPFFLIILCFAVYYYFNEVYDILIATSLFYFLKTVVECIRERELILQRITLVRQTLYESGLKISISVGKFIFCLKNIVVQIHIRLSNQIKQIWKLKTKSK